MRKLFVILLCLMVVLPPATTVFAAGETVAKLPLSSGEVSTLQQLDQGELDTIRASGNIPWIVLIVLGTVAVYFAYEANS